VVLYATAQITYNVLLHPLRRFPGPKSWAASRITWCVHQYQGRLHVEILRLHERYGSVVRVAPNELSFTSESAWRDIYGQRKLEMGKDPIFRLHTPTGAQNILVADRETHTRQRRLLAHAFSESALREQEPVLQIYAGKLLACMAERAQTGAHINVVDWLTFASFDLIGHMSFGENFGCLESGTYAPFVAAITAMASELSVIQMCKYWGVMGLRMALMPKRVLGQRQRNMKTAMETVQKRIKSGSEHRDFLHYILRANDEKGMSSAEINVNAFSLSIAGSESTATALSGAFFLLLNHPEAYKRLVREIRSAHSHTDDITLASTSSLNYLEAVLRETLRMYPPVAITMPRVVPASPMGGYQIDGDFVPSGIAVGVNHFAASNLSANFSQPDQFLPERWLTGGNGDRIYASDVKEASQPFSFGPRNCLGKNIARAEMRLLLAKLLFAYDWKMDAGQEGWMDQKVQGFWQKKPLWCKTTRSS